MEISRGGDDHQLTIASMPRTAVQALYHAVTGKTENLAKSFFANVVIGNDDIEQLMSLIFEQINHYDLLADPTVTIVVKDGLSRSATYSSWRRYQELRLSTKEITSEVLIKVEFVMTLPGTVINQRCVISISLDSALPVLCDPQLKGGFSEEFSFFIRSRGGWNGMNLSIDFVDFLVAKNFMAHIEEWFKGLKQTHRPKFNKFLVDAHGLIRLILSQSPRLGLAIFLLTYVYLNPTSISLPNAIALTGIGLLIMAFISIAQANVTKFLSKRIINNFMPGVILLTTTDNEKYNEKLQQLTSPLKAFFSVFSSVSIALIINISSSFLYSWLTNPN